MQARVISVAINQMQHIEEYLVDPSDYNAAERELVTVAFSIARYFGLKRVLLVQDTVSFAGGFIKYQGENRPGRIPPRPARVNFC